MARTRWLFVIVGGILVGLIFARAMWLVLRIMGGVGTPGAVHLQEYRSNEAQIYFTAPANMVRQFLLNCKWA